MKYRFHRAATGEHYDNVNFYEGRLPGLGADYLKEFETIMAHICTAPNFYPTIGTPDIHKPKNRSWHASTSRQTPPLRSARTVTWAPRWVRDRSP